MLETDDRAAFIDDRPVGPGVDSAASALAEFRMAIGLYALWIGLVYVSVALGQTVVPHAAAVVLLGGIAATNALFLLIARSSILHRPPQATVTLAQCIIGVTWATLFTFLVDAPGDLVLGMYASAFVFSVLRVSRRSLLHLALFATLSFSIVVLLKEVRAVPGRAVWPELMRILVFTGVIVWLLLYGRHLHHLKSKLSARNDHLRIVIDRISQAAERNHLTKSFNRHYILDSLTREKGRTDRSNHPFSVCVLDIDHLDEARVTHGPLVCDRILKQVARHVRGELRAMDGCKSGGNRHSFGRFSEAEYIVILPQTNQAGARRCAERIRAAIELDPIDAEHAATISGGVVEYHRGETIPELLERADDALSLARSYGGNQIVGGEPRPTQRADVIPLHGRKT